MFGSDRRRFRDRSRLMRDSSLGTHIERTSQSASRSKMRFSDQRLARRAGKGEISTVVPRTSTYESRSSFRRRQHRRDFVLQDAKRIRWRFLIGVLVVIALAVAAGLFVSRSLFVGGLDGRIALGDEKAVAALDAAPAGSEPVNLLVAGLFSSDDEGAGAAGGAGASGPSSDFLCLLRIDPQAGTVSAVNIPAQVQATLGDGARHTLADAYRVGGNAQVISAVKALSGQPVHHLLTLDASGLVGLVDALGGIDVELAQEADDPDAGSIYLPAGSQHLSGEQALAAVRADNYASPAAQRSAAQIAVMRGLIGRIWDLGAGDVALSLDSLAGTFRTDLSVEAISALRTAFPDGDPTLRFATLPGTLSGTGSARVYSVSDDAAAFMFERLAAGDDPATRQELPAKAPSEVSVTVKNGAGIAGGASQAASALTNAGYRVEDTGNMETYVYTETLIVYKDSDLAGTAQAIAQALGSGRATDAGAYYTFDTDILVVIGKDWVAP